MAELRSSYRLSPSASWPLSPAAAERWFVPPWTMLPIAARQCRVRNPMNGVVAELTAERHAVLSACEGCRTLAEHAAIVGKKLDIRSEDSATVAQWLRDFAATGLLTSLNELIRRLEPASPAAPATFGGIVIRTCDRPALLQRVLASAAVLAKRHERHDRLIVLDDSRDAGNRAANRRIVSGHADLDGRYLDLAAARLQRELERRVPQARDAIAWLIGPPESGEATYGRPVNTALLLGAGQRLLMLDDDALLEPRRAPMRGDTFAIDGANDELACYRDAAALDADCTHDNIDPIAAHLDALGQSISSLWQRFSKATNQTPDIELDADDAQRFDAGARAIFTQNHALGDPGSSLFPYHLLSLPAASRAKLFEDPSWPEYAFTRRINWRGQPRPRLATKRPLTLTTLTGIDNSIMLPPTVRAHRNEDLLLGQMAQHVHPAGWFVDLPFGLPHWRDPVKTWLAPASSFAQEPIHFLMDHLGGRASLVASDSPENRIRSLAAVLFDLANASARRVTDLLIEQAADTATRTLFSINVQLDDAALPPMWKDALRPWLSSPALATDPANLKARIASPAAIRALAASYGCALDAWPELWSAARDQALIT